MKKPHPEALCFDQVLVGDKLTLITTNKEGRIIDPKYTPDYILVEDRPRHEDKFYGRANGESEVKEHTPLTLMMPKTKDGPWPPHAFVVRMGIAKNLMRAQLERDQHHARDRTNRGFVPQRAMDLAHAG